MWYIQDQKHRSKAEEGMSPEEREKGKYLLTKVLKDE